jgi:hypothetical protein
MKRLEWFTKGCTKNVACESVTSKYMLSLNRSLSTAMDSLTLSNSNRVIEK